MAVDNQFDEEPVHEHFDFFNFFGGTKAARTIK